MTDAASPPPKSFAGRMRARAKEALSKTVEEFADQRTVAILKAQIIRLADNGKTTTGWFPVNGNDGPRLNDDVRSMLIGDCDLCVQVNDTIPPTLARITW